jgi:hypothetical protein
MSDCDETVCGPGVLLGCFLYKRLLVLRETCGNKGPPSESPGGSLKRLPCRRLPDLIWRTPNPAYEK